jgi:uncharacterized protein YecT (DUF1311 family)
MIRLLALIAVIAVTVSLGAGDALAQKRKGERKEAVLIEARKAAAEDIAAIQGCLEKHRNREQRGRECVGLLAEPCAREARSKSAAAVVACHVREHLVWEDVLSRTYEQVRAKVDAAQSGKLHESQRAFTEARRRSCDFFWEFYRGPLAGPQAESCYRRTTASRALDLMILNEGTARN